LSAAYRQALHGRNAERTPFIVTLGAHREAYQIELSTR
jgi:hypothetical protein